MRHRDLTPTIADSNLDWFRVFKSYVAISNSNSNATAAGVEVCNLDSMFRPLLPNESLNPCFLAIVISAIYLAIGIFAAFQISQILFNNYCGIYRIKYSFGSSTSLKSVGLCQLIKLAAIIAQVIFAGFLLGLTFSKIYDVKVISILAFILSTVLAALPLHLLEPTRSIIPLASLLIYWSGNVIISGFALLHDTFGEEKIYKPSNPSSSGTAFAIAVQWLIFANAILILVFELYFYSPTTELVEYFDLNEWERSNIRDIFTEVSISWLQPTIKEIYEKNELDEDTMSLPILPHYLESEKAYQGLSVEWEKQKAKHGKNASLVIPLFLSNFNEFCLSYICDLSDIILSFTQPFLLKKLLSTFAQLSDKTSSTSPSPMVALLVVLAMFLVSIARMVLANRGLILLFRIIFKVQTAMSCMIYEKALKLSPESRKTKTTGDIINHLSTDVTTLEELSELVNNLINNPLQLVFCLASLYSIIGSATWGGVVTTLILVPISSKVSTSMWLLYNDGLTYKDERVRLTSEILSSIKSIKLYSWEKPMLERLDGVRNGKEIANMKQIGVYNAISTFLWSCIPFFISCACFSTFVVLSDIPLTPAVAFPALALFDMVSDPFLMLPNTFASFLEIKASLKRMNEYFLLEELDNSLLKRTFDTLKPNDLSVNISNSTFLWKDDPVDSQSSPVNIALSNINFTARKGQMTCIVGKVGSGKSTLIKGLLGEIPVKRNPSSLNVNGTIAYCSQSPWILNATVKENILFGCRYDKGFYETTIRVCELLSDFQSLPDGDKTVVGEKGISLSGGQKARVSLARAVYARADVYLLDDVLSAVDAHVGKNIIKNVLSQTGILATKTIILASNSINVLHEANNIILLQSGEIAESGTYSDVMKKENSQLAKLIKEYGKKEGVDEQEDSNLNSESGSLESSEEIKAYEPETQEEPSLNQATNKRHSIGTASVMSYLHVYDDEEADEISEQLGEDGRTPAKERKTGHTKENNTKGRVPYTAYLEYFKACNYTYVFLYLFLTLGTVASSVLGKYILKYWSELNESNGTNTDTAFYLGFYTFSVVLGAAFTLIGGFIVWTYCILRGSRIFHDNMAGSVLRSPMSFFETTPVGRILNRFSEDIGMLDDHLPWVMIELLEYVLSASAVFVVIIVNVPPMAIMIFILMIIYNEIRKFFIPASREFKRLRAAKKSPVYSHLQELVNGVETLRAYNQAERFTYKGKNNLNVKIRLDYLLTMCNRWLSLRLQLISAILLISCGTAIIFTLNTRFQLSVGLVGFVMSYVLSITTILSAIVRRWAEVESKSVSIERLNEYCNLPTEDEMIKENNRPQNSWPKDGAIQFVNYSTRYRENLDPVLKNISLDIKPGEKIGIVGRTGAGKSSLTLALFRIIEATTGNIKIDDITTSDIGLFDLRSKLSIIPQDSHTVEGSVRQNLDPFGSFNDEKLWKVLELAHLKEHVESMKTEPEEDEDGNLDSETLFGLDAQVYEGGSNLSSGQKQLLCLARALLNPSKVLILDEATAAVDVETDKIIQDTIRKEFKEKTILTIAHRLDTIMDSDRVLVLDKGEVREFAPVQELLEMENGIFRLLCEEGGYLR